MPNSMDGSGSPGSGRTHQQHRGAQDRDDRRDQYHHGHSHREYESRQPSGHRSGENDKDYGPQIGQQVAADQELCYLQNQVESLQAAMAQNQRETARDHRYQTDLEHQRRMAARFQSAAHGILDEDIEMSEAYLAPPAASPAEHAYAAMMGMSTAPVQMPPLTGFIPQQPPFGHHAYPAAAAAPPPAMLSANDGAGAWDSFNGPAAPVGPAHQSWRPPASSFDRDGSFPNSQFRGGGFRGGGEWVTPQQRT
ncbi:hypothetical protein C8Q80DRAFT_1125294 [Daedaleopsis nitida]|nr:hypothetical protein C8Q80DRAFT_1125294 [Daedaleopsis nitida]